MITTNLGQGVPSHMRVPFQRPRPADPNLMPHMLRTRFTTHLRPHEMMLPAAQSFQPKLPQGSGYMRPGVSEWPSSARDRAAARPRPAAPAPGPTAGYFGAGAPGAARGGGRGSIYGRPFQAPYTTAVTRALMPFRQDPRTIRGGVLTAPDLIRRMHAPGYPYVAQPAGYFQDKAY